MSVHPFDHAIELAPNGDGRFLARTSSAYANMVGPFGGATAAVLLQAALVDPTRIGEPISLSVNFASALRDGEFEVHAHAAKTNRSTQHWSIDAWQGGEIVATATAVFAQRRETWSRLEATPPDDVPSFQDLRRADLSDGPPWVHRYDMRFVEGGLPRLFDGTEQPDSRSSLWVRDDPPRCLDFASLVALCDSFFPRVFLRRRIRVPIGTVTLTAYFHADGAMLAAQADRPVLGRARALNFRNGYFDQSAEIWDDQRQLLASTHQMVYYRE